ncbi:hypothetical protein [Sinomonas halotolerans]|uniref:ABM domain-containing protein n=1 Tax=Sinomonas halotolerans TaxID=1644133 RepID=A0ABU9X0F5_9MICC
MSAPFIYISTFTVRPGRLDDALAACRAIVGQVEAQEPQVLAFHFFLDEQGQRIATVQLHPDGSSMEFHMSLIADHLAASGALIESYSAPLVLGEPPAALAQWWKESGTAMDLFPAHLAGVTRVGAPADAA